MPGEERWPGLAVGGDPTYAAFRRWHVEHDDVVGVIGENRIQVTAVHRIGPVLNERPDLSRCHSCEHRPRPPSGLIAIVVILGLGVLAAGDIWHATTYRLSCRGYFHQAGEARLESRFGFLDPTGDARGWRSTPPITAGTKVPMIDDQ